MNQPQISPYLQTSSTYFAKQVRALRRKRGWTLADVEIQSKGSISAVSMGAYERQTRSLSLEKCIEIAELFRVPLTSMLSDKSDSIPLHRRQERWMIDLRLLLKYQYRETDPYWAHITKFIQGIILWRSDWNGEVISLRRSDIDLIAIVAEKPEVEIVEWLTNHATLS